MSGMAELAGISDVLALFRTHDELTRSDVMRLTGLARSTVNQRLDALASAGLLIPAGASESTGGRPPSRFAFHAKAGTLLIAHTGASGFRAAICDFSGEVLADQGHLIDIANGPDAVLDLVEEAFTQLLKDQDKTVADVQGIGISVPGPVEYAAGRVISPPIMTGWDGYDIPRRFNHYQALVLVDNDVNAMAYGEYRRHYADLDHLLMVKVSTGIGAGIISNGSLLRGAQGAAGDIGHIRVKPTADLAIEEPEPVCRCGNRGCAEAYAGGWAIMRDLNAAGRTVHGVRDVAALARSGDTEAVRLARRAGRIIGQVVADAVSLLNPSLIVLGGQLAKAEELFLAGIREMVYQRPLPLATRSLQITTSKLDAHAGVTGMALLCADELLSSTRGFPPRV